MHVDFVDESILRIYLPNIKVKEINFESRDEIEFYFKKIFNDLKKIFDVEIKGYYNINVYKDEYYGVIMELIQEDIDYIDFFDNQVEMNIKVIKKDFIYEINDYFFINKKIKNKIKIYSYKNKIYIKVIGNISDTMLANILEFGTLIYDEYTDNIVKKGKNLEF